MTRVLFGILALGAAAAWFLAAVSGFAMLKHRAPHRTLGWMVTHGIAWFDPANFTPQAEPWRRRFIVGFVAFFVFIVAEVAATALFV